MSITEIQELCREHHIRITLKYNHDTHYLVSCRKGNIIRTHHIYNNQLHLLYLQDVIEEMLDEIIKFSLSEKGI